MGTTSQIERPAARAARRYPVDSAQDAGATWVALSVGAGTLLLQLSVIPGLLAGLLLVGVLALPFVLLTAIVAVPAGLLVGGWRLVRAVAGRI